MKLIEKDFNEVSRRYNGLAIYKDDKLCESGFIGDVLKKTPHFKDCEIKSENAYFDEWVIRL